MSYFLHKDRAFLELANETGQLESANKKLKDDLVCALAERDVFKKYAKEEQRWSKRKVDDARASADAAWTVAAEADKRARRAELTQQLQQHQLTHVGRPAVPRDDLLPPSQTPTPKPSQKPTPKRGSYEAQKARNKDRKASQREHKRNGERQREQLRRAHEQEGAVGGYV